MAMWNIENVRKMLEDTNKGLVKGLAAEQDLDNLLKASVDAVKSVQQDQQKTKKVVEALRLKSTQLEGMLVIMSKAPEDTGKPILTAPKPRGRPPANKFWNGKKWE